MAKIVLFENDPTIGKVEWEVPEKLMRDVPLHVLQDRMAKVVRAYIGTYTGEEVQQFFMEATHIAINMATDNILKLNGMGDNKH